MPDDFDEAFEDLTDVPLPEATEAAEALRFIEPGVASGPGIRRMWVDLTMGPPEPAEAARILREVFSRHRSGLGESLGDRAAHRELETTQPLLAEVARAWGGPPPGMARDRMRRWDEVYFRVASTAKRRKLLNRQPGGGHASIAA